MFVKFIQTLILAPKQSMIHFPRTFLSKIIYRNEMSAKFESINVHQELFMHNFRDTVLKFVCTGT